MQQIEWDCNDSCYCCGDDNFVLRTEADQSLLDECSPEWTLLCNEDDAVICATCGFEHYVSLDSEGNATLAWNEEAEHNLACWSREHNEGMR